MSQDEVAATVIPSEVQDASAGSPGPATVSNVVSDNLVAEQESVRQRVAKAAAQKVVAHPTVEERQRKGRVARAEARHEELAAWQPPSGRADPVALLEGQETSRCKSWSRCDTHGWP